jgi:DNA-binding transcriptional regulator YiaG
MKEWTPAQIEEFRKTHNLTRRALGELLGVTVQAVYQWERGLRAPGRTVKLLLDRVEREVRKR